jgi:hypothetical protein
VLRILLRHLEEGRELAGRVLARLGRGHTR